MTVAKCLFCLEAAVFDFGAGNLVCSGCFEIRVLRGARISNLNLVASGQHHPDASAAVTPLPAQVPGVAAVDPSSQEPRVIDFFRRRIS